MRIVLDTNVVVSGLLSAGSNPAVILELVLDGSLELCVNDHILAEYSEVSRRPKFRFEPEKVDDLLLYIESASQRTPRSMEQLSLPDLKDVPFLEAAILGEAQFLVTGNIRHFPAEQCRGVTVVTPAEFLSAYRRLTT